MTGLRVGHTEFPLRVRVPLILRLDAHCQWLWTSDCTAEAAGLPAETAKGSLNASSSLLNVLIQCSEISGMGAEAREARHKAHRTGRASRLRGSVRPRLDAVGTWLVPRRLPTSLVRPGMSPVCLPAGGDKYSQLSAKIRENGLDTRPPDGALARSHSGAGHRLLPLSPADFVRSHRGRYLMPAVRLFVVAEDKAGLGRGSA